MKHNASCYYLIPINRLFYFIGSKIQKKIKKRKIIRTFFKTKRQTSFVPLFVAIHCTVVLYIFLYVIKNIKTPSNTSGYIKKSILFYTNFSSPNNGGKTNAVVANEAKVEAFDNCNIIIKDKGIVFAYDDAKVISLSRSKIHSSDKNRF